MLNSPNMDSLSPNEQEARVEATPTTERSFSQKFFGVATRWQTYARLLYLLLAFVTGVATFVALVTLLSAGAGLAITVVGIPLLILTMFGWCYAAEVHRLMANALLGTNIRPLPFEAETGKVWSWKRIRDRARNSYTWRALVFGFVSFGIGVVALMVAWHTIGQTIILLLMPVTYWIGEGPSILGGWKVDTLGKALLCSVAGVLLFIPALHVVNLTGIVAGRIVEKFLQSEERPTSGASTPTFDRAVTSTIAWPGWTATPRDAHEARVRTVQLRAWQVSAGLYLATMVVLVVINGLASPGQWWVLWPAWGWGIVVAAHTGYLFRGHLGGHAALYGTTMIGLFVIDAMYSDQTWFYWPTIAWGIAVAAHMYVYFGFSRVRIEDAPALVALAESVAAPEPPPGLAVNIEMRNVLVDGAAIDVTPREFDLLALLTSHPGRPFSRDELLDRIWKNEFDVTDRTIDTHVQRLRRKLGLRSEVIQTVWGIGYRYQP